MSASNGWKICELDELAHLDVETLSASTPRDFQFYYLDISSASEGHLDLPSTETQFREAPSRARKVVHRHDVLMSMVRPNLKAFAYFNHNDEACVASTGFSVLTAKENASAKFLLYAILSEDVSRQIDGLVIGSNYPAINSSAVRSLKIYTPPKPEQTKIAEILSTVDRAIEQTEALIAKQQRIKTGLMQDLLTRGIDENGNLRSEQTHPFKDSPLGRIPVEWEVKPIESKLECIIDYRGRTPVKTDAGIPLITAKNVREGFLCEEPREFIDTDAYDSWMTRGIPEPGDVMITTEAPMGNVARVPDYKIALAQRLITLPTKKNELSSDFLFWMLHWSRTLERLELLTSGSTVVGIKQSVFRRVEFSFPPLDEQSKIAALLNAERDTAETNLKHLSKLRALKTALMQDLLTGRKRVTDLLDGKERVA
jgi:type I restriction enzyme S subunit